MQVVRLVSAHDINVAVRNAARTMLRIDQDTDIEGQALYRKTEPIKAVQMDEPFQVQTLEGPLEGDAGDWLAEGSDGERWPIEQAVFEHSYAPVASRVAARWIQANQDWRETPVRVFGRPMTLGQVKGGRLFHGSPLNLAVGTILEPGHGRNWKPSAKDAISITSKLEDAVHWATLGGKVPGFVYEVEPLGPVDVWRVGPETQFTELVLYEGRCPKARVLRQVRTVKAAS